MPSPKSTASKLPQEKPECTTSPAFRRYPYLALLEGLPKVVTQNKLARDFLRGF